MDPVWRIQLLGGLHALRSECVLSFQTHKTGVLLAYLAYYRHRARIRAMLPISYGLRRSRSRPRQPARPAFVAPSPVGTAPARRVVLGRVLIADHFSVQLDPAAS